MNEQKKISKKKFNQLMIYDFFLILNKLNELIFFVKIRFMQSSTFGPMFGLQICP